MNPQKSDVILERMMSLHPKIIDLTLDRMWGLLAALDHPERALPPVIHIAGTNGKGSTLAMIRAGLEAEAKAVHAYTSPHLARFHERIRLAGTLISEPALTAVLDECVRANGDTNITYFEITTIAALVAFSRVAADYTLLEVGLGGRFDATNIIQKPALTIITPVSIDHQQYLGDTLAEIAGEKAGILKRGVTCIVGPQMDEALEVIEIKAARIGAPLQVYGQHWHVSEERGRLIFQDEVGLLDLPMPNLIGAHQVQNAGAAIAALRNLGFGEYACESACTKVSWPARLQRLRQGPLIEAAGRAEIWLDGGHNAAAGTALAEALTRLPTRPTHLICGMLNTKDVTGYLTPLNKVTKSLQAVSIPGETATLSAKQTCKAAIKSGIPAEISDSVEHAVKKIVAKSPAARILICGSLYLAGHVLRENS
ncbi:MAG: bifunctional folylpolyglutamate synthase/dihydrofolate synthase [Paracoccaceae bacterium]